MLRSAIKRNVLLGNVSIRHYSEGFEISKYLDRIEAITKRAPVKPKQRPTTATRSQPRMNASGQQNKQSGQKWAPQQKPMQQRDGQTKPNFVNKPRQTKPKADSTTTAAKRQPKVQQTDRVSLKANKNVKTNSSSAKKPENTSSDVEWVSLDKIENTSSSKPLTRSNRRVSARKLGSKAKVARKQQGSKKPDNNRTKNTQPTILREYIPYLSPKDGLEIVLRNQGTSAGGFIDPVDVSLTSLQPNLVNSAVTYNSRVRTLLNSVPASVANDNARLKVLIERYVSGGYDRSILESNKNSLSYQGLASEVFANHSMDSTTRQFFANVGTGKFSPKQIANRA